MLWFEDVKYKDNCYFCDKRRRVNESLNNGDRICYNCHERRIKEDLRIKEDPMEYFLQADNKDIQTFEYFASETRQYDDDIHVVEYKALDNMSIQYAKLQDEKISIEKKYKEVDNEMDARTKQRDDLQEKLEDVESLSADMIVQREVVLKDLQEKYQELEKISDGNYKAADKWECFAIDLGEKLADQDCEIVDFKQQVKTLMQDSLKLVDVLKWYSIVSNQKHGRLNERKATEALADWTKNHGEHKE